MVRQEQLYGEGQDGRKLKCNSNMGEGSGEPSGGQEAAPLQGNGTVRQGS